MGVNIFSCEHRRWCSFWTNLFLIGSKTSLLLLCPYEYLTFFSGYVDNILFIFGFLWLDYDTIQHTLLLICLDWGLLEIISWISELISLIMFDKSSVVISSNISFASSSLLLPQLFVYKLPDIFPQILICYVFFSVIFSSLCFPVWINCWPIFRCLTLFCAMSNLLFSSLNGFFISDIVFSLLTFPFGRLVPNRKRSMSRLYIVTLLI